MKCGIVGKDLQCLIGEFECAGIVPGAKSRSRRVELRDGGAGDLLGGRGRLRVDGLTVVISVGGHGHRLWLTASNRLLNHDRLGHSRFGVVGVRIAGIAPVVKRRTEGPGRHPGRGSQGKGTPSPVAVVVVAMPVTVGPSLVVAPVCTAPAVVCGRASPKTRVNRSIDEFTASRAIVDARAVADARPIVDARAIPDARTVIDAGSVVDARAIPDARPVIDTRAVADARPIVDARAIADAGLSPHARSIADAGLTADLGAISQTRSGGKCRGTAGASADSRSTDTTCGPARKTRRAPARSTSQSGPLSRSRAAHRRAAREAPTAATRYPASTTRDPASTAAATEAASPTATAADAASATAATATAATASPAPSTLGEGRRYHQNECQG